MASFVRHYPNYTRRFNLMENACNSFICRVFPCSSLKCLITLPLQFLLFVARFDRWIAGFTEDFILFVVSIKTGCFDDLFCYAIFGYRRADKGLQVGVEMALTGTVQLLRQCGEVIGFSCSSPIDAESSTVRQNAVYDHNGASVASRNG